MSIAIGWKTHPGKRRENNEDSYAVLRKNDLAGQLDALVVVADGMGGVKGGEVASSITVETLPQVIAQTLERAGTRTPAYSDLLIAGIDAANRKIWDRNQAENRPMEMSMGTTCVGATLQGSRATILNIGDSRAYLLKRTGKMLQVTEDHSHVWMQVQAGLMTREEARNNRHRNILARVVGIEAEVESDIFELDLEQGDTLLLCSDGLTTEVEDLDIGRVLASSPTAQEACDRLVDAALDGGGSDNITVVVVRYGNFTPIPVGNITDEDETTADTDLTTDRRSQTAMFKPVALPVTPPTPTKPTSAVPLPPAPTAIPEARAKQGISSAVAFLLFAVGVVGGGGGVGYFINQKAKTDLKKALEENKPVPVVERTSLELFYGNPDLLVRDKVRPNFLQLDSEGLPIVAVSEGWLKHLVKKKGLVSLEGLPTLGSLPESSGNGSNDTATSNMLVTFDLSGNRYQSDPKTKSIWKFDPKGTRVTSDIGKGKIDSPTALLVARTGDLYYIRNEHLFRISAFENKNDVPKTEGNGKTTTRN